MATSDELRAKLMARTDAVIRARFAKEFGPDEHLSDDEFNADSAELIDALLPVVVEALAQAWDDGQVTTAAMFAGLPKKNNPWREGD